MHNTRISNITNTTLLFLLLAPFTVIFYATYVFNPLNAGNVLLYVCQVVADIISIVIIFSLWLTVLLDIIQPEIHKRAMHYSIDWLKRLRTVDILVPVSSETKEIIERTLAHIAELDYPHTTYVLDDGNSAQNKELAKLYKCVYIARPQERKGYAKAGNINYGLEFCKGEFFTIFDADHAPKKEFLSELLPFFQNSKVALIQTPQYYTNTKHFIASGTAQAQEIFYKFIQPAKNSYNAAFCVGTNVMYRRSAIDEIGGITLIDHSEDVWTTILLHEHGYESIYYNKVMATGLAPETIQSFFRQQTRWARGGFSLFFNHNALFSNKLTIDQKLQYFFSNFHYFCAISILFYLSLPLMYLFFGVFPMNLQNGESWIIHYIPFFLTIYFLPWYLLGSLRLSTISTAIVSFGPYLNALLATVLKNNYKWIATASSKKTRFNTIMLDIWPHVLLLMLTFCAIIIGWISPKDATTTMITTIWAGFNAYLIFIFLQKGVLHE